MRFFPHLSPFVLRDSQEFFPLTRNHVNIGSLSSGKMEPLNDDTNFVIQGLYVVCLLSDLIKYLFLLPGIYMEIVWEHNLPTKTMMVIIIIAIIDTVGWIGVCTGSIYPVVMYGIALFAQSVYILVTILKSGMFWGEGLLIIFVWRVLSFISTLGYAYVLITKRRQTSHMESNREAYSMEPVNVNDEATH